MSLTFHFDQPCDPHARYVLAMSGILNNGAEVKVPPVKFEPFREWRPILVE